MNAAGSGDSISLQPLMSFSLPLINHLKFRMTHDGSQTSP